MSYYLMLMKNIDWSAQRNEQTFHRSSSSVWGTFLEWRIRKKWQEFVRKDTLQNEGRRMHKICPMSISRRWKNLTTMRSTLAIHNLHARIHSFKHYTSNVLSCYFILLFLIQRYCICFFFSTIYDLRKRNFFSALTIRLYVWRRRIQSIVSHTHTHTHTHTSLKT